MTVKETVREMLDKLPDDVTLEDLQYHLYVLQQIQAGEEDIREGRLIPHEQVVREIRSWLK